MKVEAGQIAPCLPGSCCIMIERDKPVVERDSDMRDFLTQCMSCGACTCACSFLGTHGEPGRLIAHDDPAVFLCTNCCACNGLCPLGLVPADALLAAKHRLIEAGNIPGTVSKVLGAARVFVRTGASFPFSFHPRTKTVFWPGCSLAGMSPEVVIRTRRLLSGTLGEEVGLALDCCGDPANGLGDYDTPRARLQNIRQSFGSRGVIRVIAGCANCVKMLHGQLPGVAVEHVLEVLPENTKARMPSGNGAYLHHPCPSYRFESIQKAALRLCGDMPKAEHTTPFCCGKGGGLSALSHESANACADEVLRQAGTAPLVTYCMGCRDQFLRRGRQAYHLLELIVDTRPKRKPVPSARQWLNRLVLALRAHFRKGMV